MKKILRIMCVLFAFATVLGKGMCVQAEIVPLEPENAEVEQVSVVTDEDIDPLTGILKGEVAIQNFIDKVSFIQNESAYEGYEFLLVFSVEKDYLKSHPSNTSEKWNAMTPFDQYVWRKAYFIPQLYLYKHAGEIEMDYFVDDFLDDALLEKSLFDLKEFPRENEVYDAVVELCKWHYNYFLVTGTVYDYYNGVAEYTDVETEIARDDIDPLTGILKGEVAVQKLIDKISFIENEQGYENFLKIYGWDIMKENYKEDNSLNTEERWESMTLFDRYIWGVACYYPRMYLYMNAGEVGNSYAIDDYLEDAIIGEKVKFENADYPREDEVYAALVELCQWHYDYFLITGTVYDYYNGTTAHPDAQQVTEVPVEDTPIAQDIQQAVAEDEELAELQKELLSELSEEEKDELGIEVPEEEKADEGSGAWKVILVVVLVLVAVGAGFVAGKKKGK